jgi:hypothetical protein
MADRLEPMTDPRLVVHRRRDRRQGRRWGAELAAVLPPLLAACGDAEGLREQRQRDRSEEASTPLTGWSGPSPVTYVDATAASGVGFISDYGAAAQEWRYVEVLGSGVVVVDGDSDGDQDLLFLNGRSASGRVGGGVESAPRGNSYWRNEGGFRFVDATAEAGLHSDRFALGGASGDYDNDGDQDIFVTCADGCNLLYRNLGGGRFEECGVAAGVPGDPAIIKSACAFADVDRDGWLDLFVGHCLDPKVPAPRECWDAPWDRPEQRVRRHCNPTDFSPVADRLYLSNRDGTFRDGTAAAGMDRFLGRTLGAVFVDLERDGDVDLFVACDRSANALWINDGRGAFTEHALRAGIAFDPDGRAQGGMGVAAGDYDGDGAFDLAATYFENEPNGLYRQSTGLHFETAGAQSVVSRASRPALGWGTEFLDADLDGRLDWVVVNGHLSPELVQMRRPGRTFGYAQPPLFFLNQGAGQFASLGGAAGEPFDRRIPGRALAAADLDDDGDLDLVLNNHGAPALLLRNDSPRDGRHFVTITLVGSRCNRDAIGATLELHAGGVRQVRAVVAGGSYLSQSDRRIHFGLGAATEVERLVVGWPDGTTTLFQDLPADRLHTLRQE